LTASLATSIFHPDFALLDDLILKHYGQTEGEQDSAETSRQTATPTHSEVRRPRSSPEGAG
jgi:hypothetical protein